MSEQLTPRQAGTNARALGINERAVVENRWAVRAAKRKAAGKPALSKRQQNKIDAARRAKEREAERAAKKAAKEASVAAKRKQEIDAMNERLDRMRRNQIVRDVRRVRMEEAMQRRRVEI